MAKRRPITAEETAQWLNRRLMRHRWEDIARDAGRDRSTVHDRVKVLAARLGITLPVINPRMARSGAGRPRASEAIPTQPRRCLGCGETFDSTGPGHRICNPCRARLSHVHEGRV